MARSTSLVLGMGTGRVRRRRILVRLLIVLGLLGVLGVGAVVWLYQALPRIAATELGHLMNARVEMGAVALRRDGSVSIAGLVVRPKQAEALYDNTILRADKVYAKFSRRSLLALSPRVTEIRVEDFLLDMQLNLNTARWNIAALRFNASGGGGGGLPAIRLQRGKLRYCKISGVQQEVVMSVPVEARFGRDFEGDPSYSFEIQTARLSGGYGDSRLSGRWRPASVLTGPGYALTHAAQLTVAGGLSSTDIPSLERAWAVDVLAGELQYDPEGNYSLTLNLSGLRGRYAPEVDTLRLFAPAAEESGWLQGLQEFFAEYQPTGTVGSLALKAGGNLRRWSESEVEGKVACQDISVCDRDFPYRLDHLSGELEFTQSTARLKRLVGRHGPVEVCIDGWTRGFGPDQRYQYQITSRNMILDRDLYAALSPEQKRFWDAFHPTGTVSADHRQTRTSPTDRRWTLSVDLNDVDAAFEGFPYPLAGLSGTMFFDRKSMLLSDIVSRANGKQIRINGKVTEPSGETPAYYISIDAKDIPLDATLREALPAQHRALFRRFDVDGLADVQARVFSAPPASPGAAGDANAVAQSRWGASAVPFPVPDSGLGVPEAELRSTPQDPNREIARAGTRHPAVASASAGTANTGSAGAADSRRVSFLADVSCRKSSLKLPCPCPRSAGGTTSPVALKPPVASGRAEGQSLVLSDITAEATVTPDSLSIQHLEGRYGPSPVRITGSLRFGEGDQPGAETPSAAPGGSLRQCRMKITARKVGLDQAVLGLLPSALMPQVAAFHPTGDVDLTADLHKADSNEPLACAVVMDCLGNRIQHECFPYPLHDLRGTISFVKNQIVLKNVTARPEEAQISDLGSGISDSGPRQTTDTNPQSAIRNPQAMIRIDGSMVLGQDARAKNLASPTGSFSLQATDLRFTENLGRALPQALTGLYRALSPQGPFDLDLTTLKISPGVGDETLLELGGKVRLGSAPLSPTAGSSSKPCALSISGAAVELSGLLEAGVFYSTKRGLDQGRARLAADRLVVRGKTVTHADIDALYDPQARKWTATNFVGDCYGGKLLGSLEIGVPEDGERKTDDGGQPPSVLRVLSSGLQYQFQVALHAVDLQQFLLGGNPEDRREKADDGGPQTEGGGPKAEGGALLRNPSSGPSSASSGTMEAALSLRARIGAAERSKSSSDAPAARSSARGPNAPGGGPENLGPQGVCRVDVANMQVGKVSPLGHALSMLRLSEPTDYRFERLLMDSYIRGDKLLISKLDLSGRNTAFAGAGTMDLPTDELNLTLTGRGQRLAAAEPSVLQSLTEGLGGAVVRIEVTGKAGSPHVQTKALPVIEDSLKILGTPEESKKGKK